MSDAATEKIVILLQARDKDFSREVEKMNRRLDKAARQASNTTYNMRKTLERDMAASALSVGKYVKAFLALELVQDLTSVARAGREAIRSVADLADQADRIGVNVETYQGLQGGFLLAGAGADVSSAALETFTQRLGDAAAGSGPLFAALTKNHIALTNQAGEMRPTIDLLRDYADVIQNLPSQAERLAAANDAFGRGGRPLVNALEGGAAGIDQMIASAREAGLVLDEELVQRATVLDDKFDILTMRASKFFETVMVESAGAIDQLIEMGSAAEAAGTSFLNDLGNGFSTPNPKGLPVPIIGDDLVDKTQIKLDEIRAEYFAFADDVSALADSIRDELPGLVDAGFEEDAVKLGDLSTKIKDLVDEFQNGRMTVEEFHKEITDTIGDVAIATLRLDDLNNVDLSALVQKIGAISGVLTGVAETAAAVGRQIAALASAPSVATRRNRDVPEPTLAPPSQLAPATAVRPQLPGVDASFGIDVPMGSGGGVSSGGGATRQLSDYERLVQSTRDEIAKLQMEASEIAAVAASGQHLGDALEYARKRAELLYAAQEDGRAITPELRAEVDALALSLTTAGQNAQTAADRIDMVKQSAEQGADRMTDLFFSIADGSRSAKDAVADLLLEVAKIEFKQGILGMFGGGKGGGALGFIGNLLAGKRAGGGGVSAGSAYLVNENTPNSELFVPSQSGGILNVPQAQAAFRGRSGGSGGEVLVRTYVDDDGRLQSAIERVSGNVVASVAPGIIRQSVVATDHAMRKTRTFGNR